MKPKNKNNKKYAGKSALIEPLSPRVLYSVDIFGLGGDIGLPDETELDLTIALASPQEDQPTQTEVVFVDTTVTDHQQIIDSLTNSSDQNTEYVVYALNDDQSITDVDEALSAHTNLAAIHFITHGTDANFRLGSSVVNTQTLAQYADSLNHWGAALAVDGDILFYGCNLAETNEGRQLVSDIANATNADVGASDDRTGHASQNADWQLEYAVGDIDIDPSKIADVLNDWESHLAIIDVDTTNDVVDAPLSSLSSVAALTANTPGAQGPDGKISLREAVIAANADASHDIISLQAGKYILDAEDTFQGTQYFGDLDITNPLTIRGDDTIISGDLGGTHSERVLDIFNAGSVTIQQLTIKEGNAVDSGGGIFSTGTDLKLNRVHILESLAPRGGGIFFQHGTAVLQNVTIQENHATEQGGGLFLGTDGNANAVNLVINDNQALGGQGEGGGAFINGTLFSHSSTFSNNDAQRGAGLYVTTDFFSTDTQFEGNEAILEGGALYNIGTTTIDRGLIGGLNDPNRAQLGGGIFNSGIATTTISDTTIANNVADTAGSALSASGGNVDIHRSTIAYNDSPGHTLNVANSSGANVEISGTIVVGNFGNDISTRSIDKSVISGGYNLTDSVIEIEQAGDEDERSAADIGLATQLIDNGGSVLSYSISQNSLARDNGDPTTGQAVDTTGAARTITTDIGAYEFRDDPAVQLAPSVAVNLVQNINDADTILIDFAKLFAIDPDTPPADITYTLLSDPDLGELRKDGIPLDANDVSKNTFTQTDINSGRIQYINLDVTPDSTDTDQFTFTISDGTNPPTPQHDFIINVTDVNHAPVLDNSANYLLDPVAVNDQNPPGTSVADILQSLGGTGITDADRNDLTGIALTFANAFDGTWEYQTTSTSNWAPVGEVKTDFSLLLDTSSLLRFIPNPDFNRQANLVFHASDF